MPSRKVEFRAGEHYHLYNRGHNCQPIFFDRENYMFFLRKLREHLAEVVEIVAYCLMPNHYHLLAYLRQDDLSAAMQAFTVSYAKSINKRLNRVGSLFQGPFRAIHVDRDDYLLHLSRYIHLNPVMGKLVQRPQDWEFSSYVDYMGVREGTLPHPAIVLSQFSSAKDYQRFVESYVDRDKAIISHLLLE